MFAPRYGIAEDEATGAAAVRLVSRLGRPVTIRQGAGSLLHAAPARRQRRGRGRGRLDEVRDYRV